MNTGDGFTFEERLRLAQDPATPSAVLEIVSAPYRVPFNETAFVGLNYPHFRYEGDDPALIWHALVANPSTPPQTLTYLSVLLPEKFYRNPVASLLPLEPQFMFWIEETGKAAVLLRDAKLPGSIAAVIKTMARNRALREEAAFHVTLTKNNPDDSNMWQAEVGSVLCACVRASRGYARHCFLNLVEAGILFPWLTTLASLTREIPSPDIQGYLPTPEERKSKSSYSAASDPDTTVADLRAIAKKHYRKIAFTLIQNPTTPDDVLIEILADWPHVREIRRAMALRPNLPPTVAQQLAKTSDCIVHRVLRHRGYGTGDDGMSPGLRDEAIQTITAVWRNSPLLDCLTCACLPQAYDTKLSWKGRLDTYLEGEEWRKRCWLGRLGIALMPRVAERVPEGRQWLETLREDGNRLVRAAARARLADPEAPLL